MTATRCLIARTVTISLTRDGAEPQFYDIAIPVDFPQDVLEAYLRERHPDETVEIVTWGDVHRNDAGFPITWLLPPENFTDYRTGTRA